MPCAVVGIIAHTDDWTDGRLDVIKRLLLFGSSRGTDATGIGWIEKKQSVVVKGPVPAAEFVKEPHHFEPLLRDKPRIVIGHCRAATSGSEKKNHNNHPLQSETGMLLTHNGVVYGGKKDKCKWEVDSEQILRSIETTFFDKKDATMIDAIQQNVKDVSGSQTCALIYSNTPNTIWLWAKSNPLHLAYIPSKQWIVYGSTDFIVKAALSTTEYHLDYFTKVIPLYPDMMEQVVPNRTLLQIDIAKPFTIEEDELPDTTANYVWYGSYKEDGEDYSMYTKYGKKSKREERRAKLIDKRDDASITNKVISAIPRPLDNAQLEVYIDGYGWINMDEEMA